MCCPVMYAFTDLNVMMMTRINVQVPVDLYGNLSGRGGDGRGVFPDVVLQYVRGVASFLATERCDF